jgi:hypothetical protein
MWMLVQPIAATWRWEPKLQGPGASLITRYPRDPKSLKIGYSEFGRVTLEPMALPVSPELAFRCFPNWPSGIYRGSQVSLRLSR